jgi:anti-anti-sigma regulatory factor
MSEQTTPIAEHRIIVPQAVTRTNREGFYDTVIGALNNGQKHIVLNFGRCEEFDGAGMGKLVTIKHKIQAASGTLVLEHIPDWLWERYFSRQPYAGVFTVRDR